MLIAISGTPGTGKTAVAKILVREMNARIITTNYLARKYKIKMSFDRKRETKIVDVKKLSRAAKEEAATSDKDVIFEGHLSHFAQADVTIVLRTSPAELQKRLSKRGWNREKIRENIEAEAIGIISSESKHAAETDTTHKTPRKTAEIIQNVMSSHQARKRYSKRIDWTKEYITFLRRKPS